MRGLALEGGGAKGAFHMGAVKALLEEGYTFDGVVGTSIGAINGAVIAQGDFELGYNWWTMLNTSLLFDIDEKFLEKFNNLELDRDAFSYAYTKIKKIWENKGLDTKKIRKMLEGIIDEKKLRKSKMEFGLVTVEYPSLKPVRMFTPDIPEGALISYIMASASFPLFKNEEFEGVRYLDGGFFDNCPIGLLSEKNYDEIFAVRTLGFGISQKLKESNSKIITINPSKPLGPMLRFDNKIINENINLGYCDTMRVLQGLRGEKYYLRILPDEKDAFFASILSISSDVIFKAAKLLNIKGDDPKRILFERIIPIISDELRLPSNTSYEDVVLSLMEYIAEQKKIGKYKVRTLGEFAEEIALSSRNIKEKRNFFKEITGTNTRTPVINLIAGEIMKNFM